MSLLLQLHGTDPYVYLISDTAALSPQAKAGDY
jgi:hypothetical protein